MAQTDEARQLFDEGLDAYRAGEYEEALDVLAQARDLFIEAGDRIGETETLGSLGVIHIQLEEWDKAQQLLDEALASSIDSEDRSNQAKVLGNLGMMYTRQGEREKAAEAYQQSVVIFHELGEADNEKAVARQLSKLKLKEAKFLDALGEYAVGPEGEEEASGAQKLVRKLYGLLGRLGGGPIEEGENDKDEVDVIDVTPELDDV